MRSIVRLTLLVYIALIVGSSNAQNIPLPPGVTPTANAVAGLETARFPSYGTESLAAGFLPDPFYTLASGGGGITVGGDNLNDTCGGYADPSPTFRLSWGGRSTRLRFLFIPTLPEDADAALIVRTPSGEWVCNRDYAPGLLRPMVEFIEPETGDYNVWVLNETAPYTPVVGMLYVTEKIVTPDSVRSGNTLPVVGLIGFDETTPASVSFADGAPPTDPYVVENITGGGDVNMLELNGDTIRNLAGAECPGFYPAAPSFAFTLEAGTPYLRLFFVGTGGDPTLVVRMPDGLWYCDDDSFDTEYPTVTILGNISSGVARVWVGSYVTGERPTGTLSITRGNANPTDPARAARFVVPTIPTPSVTEMAFIQTPITLELEAPPNAGSMTLESGFQPDPQILTAYAGGSINATPLGLDCAGYITPAPDIRLNWSGSDGLLRIFFVGNGDATLVVRAPDGRFLCNDDSFGLLMPSIDLASAPAGTYLIWLGSIADTLTVSGAFYVTERREVTPINPAG